LGEWSIGHWLVAVVGGGLALIASTWFASASMAEVLQIDANASRGFVYLRVCTITCHCIDECNNRNRSSATQQQPEQQ
jgi:hypothetical protein